MKKYSRMFSVLMAAVIMAFALSPKAQAAEIVYDLDISGVSAYKNISGDVLRLDNLVNDDFLVSFDKFIFSDLLNFRIYFRNI